MTMRLSRSIRVLTLALAAWASVVACAESGPSGPDATASVSGVVTAEGGAAVAGATVKVGSATTTSGASGAFALANLPVGSATIETSAEGFIASSQSVSLSEGSNTHDVVLTPTPTATLIGVVTATGGGAVEGATVKVGSATTTTGADGAFELTGLPVGSATVVTSAPGFDTRSQSISLAAGGNTHDVVLTPTPTATVAGVVTDSSGAAVEGATVKIGASTATTGADGAFVLENVPVGNVTIITTAPRFETRMQTISLAEGANVHDVVLALQTLFIHGNAVAYLPLDVVEYRAAIVFLPGLQDPSTGLPLDSRGLVRGTNEQFCSIWCGTDKQIVRAGALELLGGDVALIGTTTLVDSNASYQTLLQALTAFGTQSLHPELANVPIFIVGHSMGGCTAYGFSRVHGERVAGFLTMKGGCHNQAAAAEAATVPGHFLIGDLDEEYRRQNITGVFEAGRAAGAPWALSTDAFQHGPILDFDMMFDYIAAVLDARLPLTPGEPLRAMTETDGWLGNRTTGAIATHACYDSAKLSASWLPTEETARDWQRMAEGTVVIEGC